MTTYLKHLALLNGVLAISVSLSLIYHDLDCEGLYLRSARTEVGLLGIILLVALYVFERTK